MGGIYTQLSHTPNPRRSRGTPEQARAREVVRETELRVPGMRDERRRTSELTMGGGQKETIWERGLFVEWQTLGKRPGKKMKQLAFGV